MLSLIVPVYLNEGSIPALLVAVNDLNRSLHGELEAVFVVDGSPDRSHELLRNALPHQSFKSTLILLSRNFGSLSAIRTGLEIGSGDRFAVMAADLQEPLSLILEIDKIIRSEPIDIVVAAREARSDPLLSRFFANLFWMLYRKYIVPEVPRGGVDIFGCNRIFRDALLMLKEQNSSLIAQIFWLGYRRKYVTYIRRSRESGKSAWTLRKKMSYLGDSIFAFTDLPIKILVTLGSISVITSISLTIVVLISKLYGLILVPGYAMQMITILFFGGVNLFGLGIIGVYAWRTYENTKIRPISIPMTIENFQKG